MKNYSVVYLTEAEDELVLAWEEADDRSAVARAANEADEILARSPHERSVFLGEGLWRLEVSPLRFYFAIREQDLIVEVSNVVGIPN
ncbi:MAG TPA: hypothetical protein VF175_00890 [Lacipirellula sp.]